MTVSFDAGSSCPDLSAIIGSSESEETRLTQRISEKLKGLEDLLDKKGIQSLAKKAIQGLRLKQFESLKNRIMQWLPSSSNLSDEELLESPLYQEIHKKVGHIFSSNP